MTATCRTRGCFGKPGHNGMCPIPYATAEPSLFDPPLDPTAKGGPVRHDHPSTSHKAAKAVKSGSQQAQVMQFLDVNGAATAYEVSKRDGCLNGAGDRVVPNQVATRFGELRDLGYIEPSYDVHGHPVEHVTTPGNTGLAHQLTDLGRREAHRLTSVELRTPRQRWGTCCPHDPRCDHSYMDEWELVRYMDHPITDQAADRIVRDAKN